MTNDFFMDAMDHKARVSLLMRLVATDILERSRLHDNSKLGPEEASLYSEIAPMLSQVEYNSAEYHALLDRMSPAVRHHYQNNDHHPEHFIRGVKDMNLMQLIEMVCDWIAASERRSVSALDSMESNQGRFQLGDQLREVIANTISALETTKQEQKY